MDETQLKELEIYKRLFQDLLSIPKKTDLVVNKYDYVKARIYDCITRLDNAEITYKSNG